MKHHGPLEKRIVNRLDKAVVAVFFPHLKFEPGADPRQGRVGELGGRLDGIGGGFGQGELVKILPDGQARQDAPADHARQPAQAGQEGSGGGRFVGSGDHLSLLVKGRFHHRLHLRRRRHIGSPFDLVRVADVFDRQSVRVQRTHAQTGDAIRLHEDFGRNGLQARGGAGRGPFFRNAGFGWGSGGLGRPEAVELFGGLQVDSAAVSGGSSIAAALQHVLGDNFACLIAWGNHIDHAMSSAGAFLAGGGGGLGGSKHDRNVKPAIGKKGRRIALFGPQRQLPQNNSRRSIHVHQGAHFAGLKDPVPNQNRRTGRGSKVQRRVAPNFHVGALDNHRFWSSRHDVGNSERDHLARIIGSAVNGDDFLVVLEQERGVDAGFEKRNAEDRIPGAGIDADDRAIAGGRVKNPLAVQPGENGMRVGVVLGAVAGAGGPDQFAGVLVKGIEPVRGRAVAPQLAVMPRVMTKSWSTTGEAVRPLGKVSRPNSSIMECSHNFLPPALKPAKIPCVSWI